MSEVVLVINSGSSSIKYRFLEFPAGDTVANGLVERIGEGDGAYYHNGPGGVWEWSAPVADHAAGMRFMVEACRRAGPDIDAAPPVAVGHRVVHGGDRLTAPTLITDEVCEVIESLEKLAPLHNPANLTGIRVARRIFASAAHVAVFDTAFGAAMPPHSHTYAVPARWREEHGVRRYGFHGTSYSYVSREATRQLGRDPSEVNLIVAHLGNGASMTAIRDGKCVDSSMGMTPLEGLVMGTRSGDIDPAIGAHLHRTAGLDIAAIDEDLNKHSGLFGLCGVNDMREVTRRADSGDRDARLALEVYCYRIKKYLGSYLAVLGSTDAIVFTAGVGEHSARVRWQSLRGLETLGITLDSARNDASDTVISAPDSRIPVLVIPTNEEFEIARQTLDLVGSSTG